MTQQEVIKTFMKSLDKTSKKGVTALDAAIKACSPFNNFQAAKNAIINDCKNAKSADDFLKTYCGINLSNKDTGAITGSDAGGSMTKTAESIVPEEGSLVMFNSGENFSVNGLTVVLGKRTGSLKESLDNVEVRYFNELSDNEVYLWRSIYTWWIENSLDLISESYGDNFSFDNNYATTKKMYVIFENLGDNGIRAETWTSPSHVQKTTDNLILRINTYYYGAASGKNGEVYNDLHLDRNIAHELTHAVMASNIDYWSYLPSFVKEGTAELVHGIDDDRKNSIQKLAGNSSLLSKSLVLDEDPVKISGVSNPSYAGGYMFMRYLARQAGDLTIENKKAKKTVQTFYGDDSIKSVASNVLISSGAGDDTITNDWNSSTKKVTIYGGTGDDVILSDSSYSTLDGGTGDDSIRNWNNSVKIYGGTGDDTLINDNNYKRAKKVTIDGGTGDDYIVNWGNSSSVFGGMGDDTIWNYGSKVKINGGYGDDYIVGSGSYADNLSGGDGDDSIWGNGGNDKIYGGDGDDSLFGGYGNDTLWGNEGADEFFYAKGDGKDVIYGFEDDDMLQILNSKFSASYNKSKREIYFKVGSTKNAITLKNFDATTFNVNGDSYYISGKKLIKE